MNLLFFLSFFFLYIGISRTAGILGNLFVVPVFFSGAINNFP